IIHAASRLFGRREALQSENEEDRRGQVHRLDKVGPHFLSLSALSVRLNIRSIRSVMMNPPTTLMVAEITATKPRRVATCPSFAPAATSEPTSEMPEMAFVADISGVCSRGGTRVITW